MYIFICQLNKSLALFKNSENNQYVLTCAKERDSQEDKDFYCTGERPVDIDNLLKKLTKAGVLTLDFLNRLTVKLPDPPQEVSVDEEYSQNIWDYCDATIDDTY